jgi:hypothetical protein
MIDLSQEELAHLEAMVSVTLKQLGYELRAKTSSSYDMAKTRAAYRQYFEIKQFLKTRTPAGKWLVKRDLAWI